MTDRIFPSQVKVFEFLQSLGVKVSLTKINRDYKKGLLVRTADKQFLEKDVLNYANILTSQASKNHSQENKTINQESILPDLYYYVQGSSQKPYTVTFKGEGKKLKASCTCPAGMRGKLFCKHIAKVLTGDSSSITEDSDGLDLLACRAKDSPLLAKAAEYISTHPDQNPKPIYHIKAIKDIIPTVDSILSGTGLWSEYTSQNNVDELSIYMRKTYKNGKPYKNPTLLLYFRYSPILISSYYDPDIDAFVEEEGGPSSRPYCVDKISYKKIESACSTFMDRLQNIIKNHTA